MYLNRDAQVSRKFGSFYTGSPSHSPIATSTQAIQHAGLSLDRYIQSNPEGGRASCHSTDLRQGDLPLSSGVFLPSYVSVLFAMHTYVSYRIIRRRPSAASPVEAISVWLPPHAYAIHSVTTAARSFHPAVQYPRLFIHGLSRVRQRRGHDRSLIEWAGHEDSFTRDRLPRETSSLRIPGQTRTVGLDLWTGRHNPPA